MTQIIKSDSSNSKFIFKEDCVIKSFPIETGLHYDMATRFFEYYKSIGINVEYDTIFINSKEKIGYFVTKFPKVTTIDDTNINGKKIIDELIERILSIYPINILEIIKNSSQNKKISVHTRDTKSRNLFMYNENLYLLDVADFYFILNDGNNESISLTKEFMDEYGIKQFVYKPDEKYRLPENVYTYELKGALKYE